MSPSGANPRGLHPNELWQADFTHFSLPHTSLLFVVVDTHSGFIWAVPASSESTKAAIQGLLSTFSVVGLPHTLKTDNSPAFTLNLRPFLWIGTSFIFVESLITPRGKPLLNGSIGPLN